ncbi:MAG TPA: hypothetical protein VHC22_16510 [Pirellulales bacterium]|nr:hypothetical protein [Pirellulales bacterium]
MKPQSVLRWAAAASVVAALGPVSMLHAQVEALNPNPTLPAGTGSAGELERYHHGTSAGVHIGREIGGRVDGNDENPAEIMLRDIGGTNRNRRTGHTAIRGRAVRSALRVEGLSRAEPRAEEGAVYFSRRGDYENAIYAPYRGSYRERAPRRSPVVRSSNQR